MKIDIIDIGPYRWYIKIWPNKNDSDSNFESWIKEHFPRCFFKRRHNFQPVIGNRDSQWYWEMRGTEFGVPTLIALTWG